MVHNIILASSWRNYTLKISACIFTISFLLHIITSDHNVWNTKLNDFLGNGMAKI